MGEFTPITTQEDFDSRLQERLEQKERSVSKRYEGYTSPDDLEKLKKEYDDQISSLNDKINAFKNVENEIDEYKKKIAQYESDSVKTRYAIKEGIPLDLVDRIRGTTEEEIEADVKKLSSMIGSATRKVPLATEEVTLSKDEIESAKRDEAYRDIIKNLK